MKTLEHMFPYKSKRELKLQQHDYARQDAFSQLRMPNMPSSSSFLRPIEFSDECFFQVSGLTNTQNNPTSSTGNQEKVQPHDIHSKT